MLIFRRLGNTSRMIQHLKISASGLRLVKMRRYKPNSFTTSIFCGPPWVYTVYIPFSSTLSLSTACETFCMSRTLQTSFATKYGSPLMSRQRILTLSSLLPKIFKLLLHFFMCLSTCVFALETLNAIETQLGSPQVYRLLLDSTLKDFKQIGQMRTSIP